MNNRSKGEEAFAQTFQFFDIVPEKDHDELRDFLYKFAHNFLEAQEYFQLLKQIHIIKFDLRSELLYRTQGMAIQCFPLAIRRMTDSSSKRSLRKLINKVVADEFKMDEVTKINEIYEHYSFYVNKGVAHQEKHSVRTALQAFPDNDVIEADMDHLANLYEKIVREICSKFIGIRRRPHDFADELAKLVAS